MPILTVENVLRNIGNIQYHVSHEKDIDGVLTKTEEELIKLGYGEITIALVVEKGPKYFLESFKITKTDKDGNITSSKGDYVEELRKDAGVGALCVLTGKSYRITDPKNDPRVNKERLYHDVMEYYTTPLKVKESVEEIKIDRKTIDNIGVLNVRSKDKNKHFYKLDRQYIDTIATIVANAINNSRAVMIDGDTNIFNKRYYHKKLHEETQRVKRYGGKLSLIICDIDKFKEYNDTKGHTAGDKALRKIGDIIRKEVRVADVPVRYGGDEFAIIAPGTDAESLKELGNRIRKKIKRSFSKDKPKLTVSVGICQYHGGKVGVFEEKADGAMYKVKDTGRDGVLII